MLILFEGRLYTKKMEKLLPMTQKRLDETAVSAQLGARLISGMECLGSIFFES